MEEIRTMSGMDLAELRDVAEDRDLWRRTVARIQRWHKVRFHRIQGGVSGKHNRDIRVGGRANVQNCCVHSKWMAP